MTLEYSIIYLMMVFDARSEFLTLTLLGLLATFIAYFDKKLIYIAAGIFSFDYVVGVIIRCQRHLLDNGFELALHHDHVLYVLLYDHPGRHNRRTV